MTMGEEGEEAESIIDRFLNAVSASGAHTKYWNMLITCFPPPAHQQAASPPTRSTSSTRLLVLLKRFGQRPKENLPADGNTTLLTVQQCVAVDINGDGGDQGSSLTRFRAIWPVGALLCDLFSVVKGDGCASIDKRLSEFGAVLRANTAAVLLDGLSKLEEQASPEELLDSFNKLFASCELPVPHTDVTGAYCIAASLDKPSVLHAHLSLCPEGLRKEVVLECTSGGCTGKDSGSATCNATPLGLAVLMDDVKLVEMLLAKGANPNDCSDSAFSALHLAVLMKKEKTLNLLLKQAPIDPLPCLHPLTAAVCLSSKETAKTLLQTKAAAIEVNYLDKHTLCSPLMAAVSGGEVDKVKAVLRKGADTTMGDSEGFSALFYAIYTEHKQNGRGLKMVNTLLAHCPSSVNCVGSRELAPLHFAAFMGCPEICKLLLKRGATPNSVDAHGLNALHWAVLSKELTCVTLLLAHRGCSGLARQVDNFGTSPLHLAAYLGFQEAAEMLLAKGTPVDVVSKDGSTPFMWAVAAQQSEMAEVLIRRGAKIDLSLSPSQESPSSQDSPSSKESPSAQDSPSFCLNDRGLVPLQPLHVAARAGGPDLVRLILREGAQVDTRGEDGSTALHHASVKGRSECIEVLLGAGATVDARTARGETPLHLATMYSTGGAVALLVDMGRADLSVRHPHLDSSALHLSAMLGTSSCMKVLLDKKKCDVNAARQGDGYTPLHVAAALGHLQCAGHLLQHGAPVNSKDTSMEGCTPLDVALRQSHHPVVDLLLRHGGHTSGGVHHRAACLIQAVWRFHVHKRRRKLAEKWSATVLQRSTEKWFSMKKAKRLRRAQELRREQSAKVIQQHWRKYIAKKRRYEAQLVCLKSRIKHEKDAYSLILGEIHCQSKSITLPSPKAPPVVSSKHLLKGPTSPPFPDCIHLRQQPVACQGNITGKMTARKSDIHRKKGSARQSVAELASKLAETTGVLPEVAAKLQRSPVPDTEVTAKKTSGARTKPMSSDQQHRKSSLLPAVPEGKPSVVSPVHSRACVAHQCERGPNSPITAPLPPVAQQGMQGEVEERGIAPSHPPGHSRQQSEYHRRDGNKVSDSEQGGVSPTGSLLHQYDSLFSRCSELKNYFTVLQQQAERDRVFEGKSGGKVSKELLKTVQEAIRLRAEVDSFSQL